MTAWLVSEDGFRLARVDSVVSVDMVIADERDDWEKVHPTKRLARSRDVRLLARAHSVDGELCALTCLGRDAPVALRQLMELLADLTAKYTGSSDIVYAHAQYVHWPSRLPAQVWRVTPTIPEPEWIKPR